MATLEVLSIILVIVAIAVILPILLDENPGAFLENSVCRIFAPPGPPFICNIPGGNVTFQGLTGIDIFVDPSVSNSTVFWNFTGTSINGSAIMMFHPLGGDADVFANSTIFDSYWRGITGGDMINVTERSNDILIDLESCPNENLIIYNATIGEWVCISGIDFSSQIGFDPDEIMYPFLAGTSTGSQVVLSFTNYDTRAVRESGIGAIPSSLTWKWPVPANFDPTSSIEFRLYWITQTASAGTACHTLSAMGKAPTENVDGTFGSSTQICASNPGANVLVESIFTLTPAQHGLSPGDVAFIKSVRDQNDVSDTLIENIYVLVGKLRWNP